MRTGERNFASALGLVLIALGIFVAVSLISYDPSDAGHHLGPSGFVRNYGGKVGAQVSLFLLLTVGAAAGVVPLLLAGEGVGLLLSKRPSFPFLRLSAHLVVLLALSSLAALIGLIPPERLGWQLEHIGPGGAWGRWSSDHLLAYLGPVGSRLVLVTAAAVAFGYLTAMKPYYLLFRIAAGAVRFAVSLLPRRRRVVVTPSTRAAAPARAVERADRAAEEKRREEIALRREREKERLQKAEKKRLRRELRQQQRLQRLESRRVAGERPKKKPAVRKEKASPPRRAAAPPAPAPGKKPATVAGREGDYRLPPVDLLLPTPPRAEREVSDDIKVNSGILESTLADFGITAVVVGAERGPAVTRYELQPAPGVKVQKIKTLANDIALAMKAVSVRILAPIPGKAAVGIEIPNSSTALVYLREMVESKEFRAAGKQIPVAIGKDISGNCIVADITEMPHLLIAGATGSGKTVCINSLIMSLLYSSPPDRLKMILVDPKKVEMTNFHSLPHLLCPVVTDPAKSALVLGWLVREMESRYELFARAGVRNIAAYNQRPPVSAQEEELPPTVPYILLIIDELADLMLTAPVEIENAIARLAHLSRAVGIHMVLATQRPSVDVITGVIKANFPARVSFKVASKIDSRIVLDAPGADKLLGNGDLLFLPPASDRLIRAQGTLCSDEEIRKTVAFVCSQASAEYDREILSRPAASEGGDVAAEADPVLEDAIKVIKQTEQASVSILQRKLKIGYSRAARVMDQLEDRGIVGPHQGAKPREILIETYGGEAGEGGAGD